ncbi:hypothetical protein HYH03_001226 [Edaphochlamys debaryana]|uniref:Patatin n=1 Tax=Edaphochlamys debaryana TaxID=47281 RepID=A0A835YHS0_9CHLO|nr:hypothetical protein HYH03_001226 [Edaphochlamys debaryana]|eukprot:KAG2501443.1 hypothetical protein HYH03_001226 [Edaphochlamys debaryana]
MLAPPSNWDLVKKCFDLDIADFFDQLAGTSTGGLLALYLAARGGRLARANDDTLRSRPGSASGASDFYMDNGAAIFDTSEGRKLGRFLASAGQYRHGAAGLEGVLHNVFDNMTLQDLEAYGANLVVTTVDAVHKRTAFFFRTSGRPPPAYTGPVMAGEGTNGLATPLRKDDHRNLVLVRDPSRPPGPPVYDEAQDALDAARDARASQATGWLSPMVYFGEEEVPAGLEGLTGTNRNDVRYITATGGWVAPMSFDEYDFRLVDVARATSAAPVFLPPKQVRPVLREGEPLPADWRYRVFVDGGLANNDPTFMGLAQLLQRNNKAGLKDCAILSIGTGTKAAYDGYDAPAPKLRRSSWLGRLGSVLGTVALSPVRLLNVLTWGWAKRLANIPKSILHVGGLVGLTMDTNGEDKENMFRLIYYGLLRAPEGTYLRIQIKDEQRDYRRPQQPQARGGGGGAAAVQGFDWEDLPPEAKQAWRDALSNMDDPRPQVLNAYKEMGEMMAARFALRLTWWVRCFVFGLDEAAKNPFVLMPELQGLNNGKEAQGGRFLAKAIGEAPDAIW